MGKILCIGEPLLRVVPELGAEWIKKNIMKVYLGGSELNVAATLATWGEDVSYLTALPDNVVAQDILSHIQSINIDISPSVRKNGRIGIYYLPSGRDINLGGVIYDRQYSSFSALSDLDIDIEQILAHNSWIHVSAISLALSLNTSFAIWKIVEQAKANNIKISIDLNYREALWKNKDIEYANILKKIVSYCDVIMGNIWSVNKLLQIPLAEESISQNDIEGASIFCQKALTAQYPECHTIGLTYRMTKYKNPHYQAYLFHNNIGNLTHAINISAITDPVGSGDSFMAGLIYGLRADWATDQILDLATRSAIIKLSRSGDYLDITLAEVLAHSI